ncbi:SET domain protein [Ceratobasidium sp. AG-Ba]|nr:SET domain protein [Ceratobasidium sp. AG-Ba]QRW08566.1 SET domain protein [Ceratobasidium sp. AG-Ba]
MMPLESESEFRGTDNPNEPGQKTATQLGGYSFVIPRSLSPVAPAALKPPPKRRISAASSSRAAKARRTSSRSSAATPGSSSSHPAPEPEDSDEVPQSSRVLQSPPPPREKSKAKRPARSPQMSGTRPGPLSRLFNRPRVQKPSTSAPAKLQPETIVIDSSDDEADDQLLSTTRAHDVISISDSDSDHAPRIPSSQARSSPPDQTKTQPYPPDPPSSSPSRLLNTSNSPTSAAIEALPPLPPSSDVEQSPDEDQASPIAQSSPVDRKTHRASQDVREGSGSESDSSGRVVETIVTSVEQGEPSFVLNSESSSGSRNGSPHRGESTGADPQRGRERSMTLTSLRSRPPARSSPSPGSLPRSGAVTEAELEDIVANVSLHDPQPQPDKSIAQTVVAVGNIALDDDQSSANEAHSEHSVSASASASISSAGTARYKCSVSGCPSRFNTTSQLHTHMSRDHGVRLLPESKKARGKRKAVDPPKTPTKRKFYGSRLAQPPPPAPAASSSSSSSKSPSGSDVYVERTKTVGFEPFVRSLPERGSSASPGSDEDDEDDEEEAEGGHDHIAISDVSVSPPRTPAPQAPKLRRPHPKDRPALPDTPSEHLSPSKQLAIKKHEVVIPGEELVTWRVDIVNSMPESYRNGPGVRLVFEGFMDEAMRENEPCAPAIPVENMVDDQPCPPWEFVYSNRVLYGENVPRPDREALEGCDCLGPCDPNNKNCACVRKQEAVWARTEGLEDFSGFAFNEDGKVRFHHGEIYGCNSKCTCDLECQNKVWQQGRKHAVSIRKTPAKGWGVFAKEHIPPGSYLGVYTGELLTEGMAYKRSQVYDEFGRTYVLGLDFHHIPQTSGLPNYSVDAFHAGNFTRFLNHSCSPNLVLSALYVEDPDIRKPWLAFFNEYEIKAGQELTFSYTGMDANDPEDRAKADAKQKAARVKGKRGKVFEKCLCGVEGCFGILFK